jgi:transcriptional regulator GlxA family with amidase domain
MPAPGETKRIVLFTLPPVREIDLVGAVDVFTSANRTVGGKPLYDIKIVNAEKARADRKIAGMCGLSLHCQADFRSFRGEIDTLLIPGGTGVEESYSDAAALQ